MATWMLGPLRVSAGAAKTMAIAGGAAAIAGGLAFGVATAADPGAVQPGPTTGAAPTAQTAAPPRVPLHRLLAAALRRRRAQTNAVQPGVPAQRTIFGRLVSLSGGTATVRTADGDVILVRANARTKLPARTVRPGDAVVIIGRREPNGTYLAQAVLSRPAAAHEPPARPGV